MTEKPQIDMRDGWTIAVYFPPEADPAWVEAFAQRMAAAAAEHPGRRWEAAAVGNPGDPLGSRDWPAWVGG